ncbi:hypothetical protein CRUP_032422 [Coryphaenoides rupestris]|nr:hypothetical protein CRUP_032422 [Coryphaenoides rupestris]
MGSMVPPPIRDALPSSSLSSATPGTELMRCSFMGRSPRLERAAGIWKSDDTPTPLMRAAGPEWP